MIRRMSSSVYREVGMNKADSCPSEDTQDVRDGHKASPWVRGLVRGKLSKIL
jgi:hypothetical protein